MSPCIWIIGVHSIRTDTHSHTHSRTHSHTHCHSRCCCCCSQVSKTTAHLHSCWAAHCSRPFLPALAPWSLVVGLWGRMSECWPVFWPCPCFVNVQNLSNFIMLEFAGTSQLPQQPQHASSPPLLFLLSVGCQLLWRLTSGHYKAQESSRTTSSATTPTASPSLLSAPSQPHDSWHFRGAASACNELNRQNAARGGEEWSGIISKPAWLCCAR